MTTLELKTHEPTIEEAPSGRVHPRLAQRLRERNLFGALTEVGSSRFLKYVMQPKMILRNGWLLDPTMELEQSEVRAYLLSPSLSSTTSIGQRLVIDRSARQATLHTFSPELTQEIRVDMETMQVVENRVTAPVSMN